MVMICMSPEELTGLEEVHLKFRPVECMTYVIDHLMECIAMRIKKKEKYCSCMCLQETRVKGRNF